jgi:septal ring factor EnvC (AmiA/AmiB activator)
MTTPPPLPPPIPSAPTPPPLTRHYKWFWAYAIGSSFLIVILLVILVVKSTDSPHEPIADAKQRTVESERQTTLSRIEGLERQLSTLRQSLAVVEGEKAAYQAKVKDYAMDHKLAILAIGGTVAGTAIALDKGDTFSDDQKTIAGWTAAAAATYALFNHQEIIEVTDRMTKAATMIADFDSRIEQTRQQLSTLESQLAQAKRG